MLAGRVDDERLAFVEEAALAEFLDEVGAIGSLGETNQLSEQGEVLERRHSALPLVF